MPTNDFIPRLEAALARAAAANPHPLPNATPGAETSAPPLEEDGSSIGVDAGKDLMVILIGAGTSMAVALVVYFHVNLVGYPFHAQTVWFVIPVGAIACGMTAAGGFWFALRRLDRLPSVGTYLAAGLVGALSYVLIYFLAWWLWEFQGVMVRDEVGFGEFLQYVIEHQRIRFTRSGGEGVEVGKWGYVRFAINVVGFALGVLSMVAIGGSKSYCPRCKRYLKTVGRQARSSSDPEGAAAALHPVIVAILSGRIQEALELHGAFGAPGHKEYWTTTITIEACPDCGMHLATMKASVPGDRGARDVEGFVYQGMTNHSVRLST
jgi:hypothetical protein